jgi:hypothetical protein
MSPPHQGMTPNHANHGIVGQVPQQPQQPQHSLPSEPRALSNRPSPPSTERERERAVEAQLQEAAKSSLAQANSRLGGPESKGVEYPAMVA